MRERKSSINTVIKSREAVVVTQGPAVASENRAGCCGGGWGLNGWLEQVDEWCQGAAFVAFRQGHKQRVPLSIMLQSFGTQDANRTNGKHPEAMYKIRYAGRDRTVSVIRSRCHGTLSSIYSQVGAGIRKTVAGPFIERMSTWEKAIQDQSRSGHKEKIAVRVQERCTFVDLHLHRTFNPRYEPAVFSLIFHSLLSISIVPNLRTPQFSTTTKNMKEYI